MIYTDGMNISSKSFAGHARNEIKAAAFIKKSPAGSVVKPFPPDSSASIANIKQKRGVHALYSNAA